MAGLGASMFKADNTVSPHLSRNPGAPSKRSSLRWKPEGRENFSDYRAARR